MHSISCHSVSPSVYNADVHVILLWVMEMKNLEIWFKYTVF